jgi:hypothetical protein
MSRLLFAIVSLCLIAIFSCSNRSEKALYGCQSMCAEGNQGFEFSVLGKSTGPLPFADSGTSVAWSKCRCIPLTEKDK